MRKSWLFPGDNDEPYVSQRAGAYQPQSEKRRRWTKRLVILALILCVLYPFVEPYTLRTTQTAITCEDLPASIGQLRIVYVSDIHYGTQMFSDARLSSLINRINALNADIVLLGGDYARDKWSAAAFFRESAAAHFEQLRGVRRRGRMRPQPVGEGRGAIHTAEQNVQSGG